MTTIEVLESLLEELDIIETVDQAKNLVEEKLDTEYEQQGINDIRDELFSDEIKDEEYEV